MLNICYRGPLDSCNYHCWYCPFSKTRISKRNISDDQRALERFVEWVARRTEELSVLFTPWGEAAIYHSYQSALIELSHMTHVGVCGIQTNLSCGLEWLENCDRNRLRLWISWHPDQISETRFCEKLFALVSMGVNFNVGLVALPENIHYAERLKKILPSSIYVWLNAAKDQGVFYDSDILSRWSRVDPLFGLNVEDFRTLGKQCRAGWDHVLIDGVGDVRRCHFIREKIGNIYSQDLPDILYQKKVACSNLVCGCYLGQAVFSGDRFQHHLGSLITRSFS